MMLRIMKYLMTLKIMIQNNDKTHYIDTQNNDTKNNDFQNNHTQNKDTQNNAFRIMTL